MIEVAGIGPGTELEATINKYTDRKESLKAELKEFILYKQANPYNGTSPAGEGFGNSDKRFISGKIFNTAVPDISHAHLTHNISIVYKIEDDVLYLFGVYTHDDLGTGQPQNINKQKGKAASFANMLKNKKDFFKSDTSILDPKVKQQVSQKQSTAKPDYSPKAKAQPQAPQKSQKQIAIDNLVNDADKQWPNRNFKTKFTNCGNDVNKIVNLIQSEVQYLAQIKSRGNLYPNQVKYFKELEQLYQALGQR
jgi:hypothetical protein